MKTLTFKAITAIIAAVSFTTGCLDFTERPEGPSLIDTTTTTETAQ